MPIETAILTTSLSGKNLKGFGIITLTFFISLMTATIKTWVIVYKREVHELTPGANSNQLI